MAVVSYIWRGGEGVGESSAQAIGEHLHRIERHRGDLRPEYVVEEARSSNSPLHRFFEWDNEKAAEAYRLDQARDLIRRVYVKHVDQQEIPSPVRAFVNVQNGDAERSYESIASVMSDDMKRARLLQQARRELELWRLRYQHLREFSRLVSAMKEVA